MTVGPFAAGLDRTIERVGANAQAAASVALAARIAVEAPDITVTAGDDAVRLSAPGLVARVFGSRRRGPDPRLLTLVGGIR